MASPKRYADIDTPRLDIDEDGVARIIWPCQAKRPRPAEEENPQGPIAKKRRVADLISPEAVKTQLNIERGFGTHLSIGQYPESYERTKPVEPEPEEKYFDPDETETEEEDIEDDITSPAVFRRPAGFGVSTITSAADDVNSRFKAPRPVPLRNQRTDEGRAHIRARRLLIVSKTQRAEETNPNNLHQPVDDHSAFGNRLVKTNLQQSLAPALHLAPKNHGELQAGYAVWREHGRQNEEYRRSIGEAQRQRFHSVSMLPPVIFFKRVDATTRVRYVVDILTIQGDKYLRLDETHFLCAVQVDSTYMREHVGNRTMRQPRYQHWQADRNGGRPEILFELYPKREHAYSPETDRRKKAPQEFLPQSDEYGRVLLNFDYRPLKHSPVMPFSVSTEIDGWEMEALCRLDPDICHQDFLDRMLPLCALNGQKKPTKGTLNHRRRRDRMRMRIIPWPLPRQLSYSDQQVVKEVNAWQLEHNTTRGLRDLSKEEIEMQEAIMYGGHFERSGLNKALKTPDRLKLMKANLRLVRTRFEESSDEVKLLKERVVGLMKTVGEVYDPAEWEAGVGA